MTDVADTLTELEQKLKDLERELARAHEDPTPPAVPVVLTTPTPAATPMTRPDVAPVVSLADDTRARIGALHGQLDELDRFRARLQASAEGLMAEYERLLETVHETAAPMPIAVAAPIAPAAAAPAAAAPAAAVPAPAPVPDLATAEPAPPEPSPVVIASARPAAIADPIAEGGKPDSLDGELRIDAGPFADIGALARFESTLEALDAVIEVYVRGFDEDRAHIDVSLAEPTDLAAALRAAGLEGVRVTAVVGQHVTITVTG